MAAKLKEHVTRTHGGAPFMFSSYTDHGCIGVATPASGEVAILDSKDQTGPILKFSREAFSAFVEFAKAQQV